MSTQTSDFAAECREAFTHHCLTLAGIDVNQPARRLENAKRRRMVIERIDDVLDVFLDWRAIEPFDRDFR